MSPRTVLYVLLALVAGCAAVLSFSGLHGLALVCGFAWWAAPLLPLVVDAGAAAGTLAWLTRDGRARRFGRALALLLLAASVGGNAVGHVLAAYGWTAPWWLVVAVSGVAPAVLGAVVHLAVLAAQGFTAPAVLAVEAFEDPGEGGETRDEHGLSPLWAVAPPAGDPPGSHPGGDRAAELIADGAGRRRLARELGIPESRARVLLAESRNGTGAGTGAGR